MIPRIFTGLLLVALSAGTAAQGGEQGAGGPPLLIRVDGKYGYIDHDGKVLVKPQFAYALNFVAGMARVELDKQWTYINEAGELMTKKFDKPEVFKVKCEVHTWMGAYIGVFSHPYFAVTSDDGSFKLKNLPAGDYTIEAWHEKYGTQTMKVRVAAAGAATADFKFEGK